MVTMNDIAARVGVSQATVSYVLNGRKSGVPVREEMRKRILQTAEELGYRRNELARAMASGKNYVFGFVTRNPGDESSTRIMVGAQEEAGERGYLIKLLPITGASNTTQVFARLAEQRLAGVLALGIKADAVESLRVETQRFGIPTVLLDDPPPQNWTTSVVSDDTDGIRQSIAHLIQSGHRRVGFVSAQRNSPLAERRREAFLRVMAENDLPVPSDFLAATDWKKPGVIEEKVRPLLLPGRLPSEYPTALLCAGDLIAMVVQRTARACGWRVPDDLSIVGFADFLCATYADPPLTTVAQPYEEMGRMAVRHLLDEASPNAGAYAIIAPTRLIVRASTAAARTGP